MIFARPKLSQFCLAVSLVVVGLLGNTSLVCGHVYEDGFVERSLTITIRDGVGYGEYRIGLNSQTAANILATAQRLKQESTLPQALEGHPVAGVSHDAFESQQQPPSTKPLEKNEPAKEPTNEPAQPPTESVPMPPAVAVAPDKQNVIVGEQEPKAVPTGEHLTDLATIKQFSEVQKHWFADRLRLTTDGQPVELSKVSVEPAARHPYSVLVKFQFSLDAKKADDDQPATGATTREMKFDLPPNRTVSLQVTDRLFSSNHGATRYALRARGSTILLQSNVAPVLVRAERVDIKRGTVVAENGSPAIQAKLTLRSR